MELKILKCINDDIKESFVKLEDKRKLTVAFVGKKGKYVFVADEIYEFSDRPILRFSGNSLPNNCGIFLIEDTNAYTMCFSGDLSLVKNRLKLAKNYTIFDKKQSKNDVFGKKAVQNNESIQENADIPNTSADNSDITNPTKNSSSCVIDKNVLQKQDDSAVEETLLKQDNSVEQRSLYKQDDSIEKEALYTEDYNIVSNGYSEKSKEQQNKETEKEKNKNDIPDCGIEKNMPEYKSTGYVLPENFLAPPEKIPESFWDCNEDKFNEILSQNPENKSLTELIPGSKWVNVEEDSYVLGIIYDESNIPMYVCYGFPLPWGEEPPKKLEGYCQWIPVDCTHPHDDGYWVIYINAKTGERIR